MFFHALVHIKGVWEPYYELDRTSLDELIQDVVEPYVKKEPFRVSGYVIDPLNVQRLLITKTERASEYYQNLMRIRTRTSGITAVVSRGYHVTQNTEFCEEITNTTLREVERKAVNLGENKASPTNLVPPARSTESEGKPIFLAYSYRPEDDEFVGGFKALLEDKGYAVLHGKPDRLGSISEAILEKIARSLIVVIVMTKRDLKANGQYTTSSWLLDEKGAAKALGKLVAIFVEEGVDINDIGGIHGDDQRFEFTRNNFMGKVMEFVRILDGHFSSSQ